MIKNYLVVTLRNFLRNKNYTLINIIGLSIGITSCIIIFLLITYELSFDKFHSRYDHIYRIVMDSKNATGISHSASTPYPLAKAFRNDFTDVPLVTQMHYQQESMVAIGDTKLKVDKVLFADSMFFEVFDFKVLSGSPKVELGQPGKVFLTKSLADKVLKGAGHTTIKIENRIELEVAGVIQDPPVTSHIDFDMVVSMSSLTPDFIGGFPLDEWGMTASGYTYVALPGNVTQTSIEDRLKSLVEKYYPQEDRERRVVRLQPLQDIHFSQAYTDNPGRATNTQVADLVVMGVLGAFILFIACINFINLSTALAIRKSKEVGIRKTLGAKRSQLTTYFLGETFLLSFFSVFISLCVVEWLLSWINSFLDKDLDLNLFSNPMLLLFLVALIIFVTLLSGFYPAMVLSNFNPVAVLKNKITATGSSGAFVRKVLVVFQFLIAQILIIGTLIVAGQMEYFRNKPLGFDQEAVINIPLPENDRQFQESLRARLEANADIQSISFSIGAPTSDNNFGTNYYRSEMGPEELHTVAAKPCDIHYLNTYGIKLKAGRWFTPGDERLAGWETPSAQQKYFYVVNESAAKRLGFNDPQEIIGKSITTGIYRIDTEVIGVVEDFHITSLHNEIKPVVLVNLPVFYYDVGLRIKGANIHETLQYIEKNWSEVFPEYYFEYEFLDQHLAELYRGDQRTFTLFKVFAGISIFIGCLGLYGLISFMAHQRLKEVGIRKVMGASVSSIVLLFSKEFVRLIAIAFILAAPIVWYFMDQWLEGFAYRIDIHWSVFVIGIVSTLVIALATVSYRSIRAAVSNPAETLHTE